MRRTTLLLSATFATLFPLQAAALDQAKHRDISANSCKAAGLDEEFCDHIGAAAYNVDSSEWTTLAAHAQPEDGQSLCDGANAAEARVSSLGSEIASALKLPPSADRVNALADAMGRALHTLQDNCAHKGVSNQEHGWLSLSDSCQGTTISPDVQPDAVACAQTETEAVMNDFADALYYAGVGNDEQYQSSHVFTHWPSRGGVCEFLTGADNWDGTDNRWNNGLVTPGLRQAFLDGMAEQAPGIDFCSYSASELANPNPWDAVDVSGGAKWCLKLDAFCVGKADAPDEAPPWVQPEQTAPASSSDSGGGCSLPAQGPTPNDAYWLSAAGALLIARRRQRRR
jgi:hypothetical protein